MAARPTVSPAVVEFVRTIAARLPDPEGFLKALAGLNERRPPSDALAPDDVVVIEDSDAGVAAAKAAGMSCAALGSSAYTGKNAVPDLVVEALDVSLVEQILN